MRTDDLIDDLAARLEPTPPRWMERRLGGRVMVGLVLSAALLLVWKGIRPDFVAASLTGMFWMKFAYTLGLGLAGAFAVLSLGRPGGAGSRAFAAAAGVFGVLAVLALYRYLTAPMSMRHHLMMGHSAMVCPWMIAAVSLPVLGAGLWALRGMAPTRPMLAGAAAGLMAGGAGAFVYAFYCNETAAPFVAVWYTLGVAISGAAGALLGRFTLRW